MKDVFQKDDFAYSVIDEAEISQELDRSIRHALAECFPADKEVFSRCSWWYSRPSWRILAHTSKNELIGHVAIVERDVAVGPQRSVVRIAGIQSVFVRPAQRGKGISDLLLMIAMKKPPGETWIPASCSVSLSSKKYMIGQDGAKQIPHPICSVTGMRQYQSLKKISL